MVKTLLRLVIDKGLFTPKEFAEALPGRVNVDGTETPRSRFGVDVASLPPLARPPR